MSVLFLPKTALLTAWQWERHGEPPAVLGQDNLWLGEETRRQLEEKVQDVLASLRLAANGVLTPEFRDILRLLATARHRFTAWLGDIAADETATAMVAASGREAVRLVRKEEKVRIDVIDAARPAESLVDVLPPVPPARFRPVDIPQASFKGGPPEESYDLTDPTDEPAYDPLHWARTTMSAKRTGVHQCYAVNAGTRSAPITAVDVAGQGRVLTFVRPAEEPMVAFRPGSREVLTEVLYATLRGLR